MHTYTCMHTQLRARLHKHTRARAHTHTHDIKIAAECQPGSDWFVERQPDSHWSKWSHVMIKWLLWTSILLYCTSLFFPRVFFFFSSKNVCPKPKTVITHKHTEDVHKFEMKYKITEKTIIFKLYRSLADVLRLCEPMWPGGKALGW